MPCPVCGAAHHEGPAAECLAWLIREVSNARHEACAWRKAYDGMYAIARAAREAFQVRGDRPDER